MNPVSSVMTVTRIAGLAQLVLVTLMVTAAADPPATSPASAGSAQASLAQRPTDVTVIMSTSRGKYDGTYRLSQVSRICGEVTPEMSMTGERMFIVQFPDGDSFDINDVTFHSKALVGGVLTTGTFYVSVNLKSKAIGHPPAYVLDTTRPRHSGTARLTMSGGTARLKVDGVNDLGETIDMMVECKPKP